MSVEARLTTPEVFSCSLPRDGNLCLRIYSLKHGGSSIACIGKSRRAELLASRWKLSPRNRYLEQCTRRNMLSRALCRAHNSSEAEDTILQTFRTPCPKLFVKPIVHIIRCSDAGKCNRPCSSSHGMPFNRPSLCTLGSGTYSITVIATVLGRVVFAVLLFAGLVLQPFNQAARPAHAASSTADVDIKKQDSQDYYDILFKKFEEKDEEMGRSQDPNDLLQRVRAFHTKVKERKERAKEAKHLLEELHKSKFYKQSLSSHEQRVWDLLGQTFEDFKATFEGKMKADSNISPYEKELRILFDERIIALQSLKRKTSGWDNDAVLNQKVRELIEEMRLEVRKLQSKELIERQQACKKLRAEELHLKKSLETSIQTHLSSWEQLRDSDGIVQLENERLQELEFNIQSSWEKLLNVKVTLVQKETGDLKEALVELPTLEKLLEGSLWSALNGNKSSSSEMEAQRKEAQQKVVNDLTQVLDSAFEHKFLPKAVHAKPSDDKIDKDIMTYLDTLKTNEKPAKELWSTINRIVREDIESEKMSIEGTAQKANFVVAPGLQRLKAEKRAEFKHFLKENEQFGRDYAAWKQVRILTIRDRVMAQTWYNARGKRWEMSSEGLEYAVDKGLVESAQVRQDKCAMLFNLKGDSRTFFTDLTAYDDEYFYYGGFNALHLKMLGSGIPAPIVVMPIPLSQQDPIRTFFLPFKFAYHELGKRLKALMENPLAVSFFEFTMHTIEELFGRVIFPLLEILPRFIQTRIGLQLPDNAPPQSTVPFLLSMKKLVKDRLEMRFGQGEGNTAWWLTLPLRLFIIWIPYTYIVKFVGKLLRQILGPGDDSNDVEWKQKKGEKLMKKLKANNPKSLEDPVRQAFDNMRRIKNPEIRLEEFAGLEAVQDEINEIIQFLRDPGIFKEMGARPPRGVLLAGKSGTGKTTLAFAIAAEAKVPLVELNGLELEGGAWVGQGASNVRDLFKTARELAPLIILMDDFDYFAGVRGEVGDTRKQDHESLINQLLVELDGFETEEGVVLLATSSHPEMIDEALRRPGRMDRTINLPIPNRTEREIMLRKAAKNIMDENLIELVDWNEIARKTAGMTPHQLKDVPAGLESMFVSWKYTDDEELFFVYKWIVKLSSITPRWLRNSKWMLHWKSGIRDSLGLRVTKEDVDAAVACVDVFNESCPGIEYNRPGYIWTREFKFPHAVWAAGRGLVGALLPNYDVLENIWLDGGSWEGIGFTRFTKRRESGYEETSTLTRTYYEKKLVHCFGSSIAAELLLPFGRNNDLASFELEEAERMAGRMVVEFGWGPDNSQTVYFSPNGDAMLSMGEEVEMELEAKVDYIINAASHKAREMIMKNRRVLDGMLEHLLEVDAISKEEVGRLMKEYGAIYEPEPFVLFAEGEAEENTSSKQAADLFVTSS